MFRFLTATRFLIAALVACAVSAPGLAQSFPTAAANGYWWDPTNSGSGWIIEIQGNTMLVAGFVYDSAGHPTWVASTGPMASATQYTGALFVDFGGQTLTGPYQAPQAAPSPGNITIIFNSNSSATVLLPQVTLALQRFPFGNLGTNLPPGSGQGQTGWWWNPAESGRGFGIEIQDQAIFFAGYMYDASGNPIWYLANGILTNPTLFQGSWVQYANGLQLSGGTGTAIVANSDVGSVTLQFSDACDATLTLPDGRAITLQRFSFATPSVLSACFGFPIGTAMANFYTYGYQATVSFSGTVGGEVASGTGAETQQLPVNTTFNNQAAVSVEVDDSGTLYLGSTPYGAQATAFNYFDSSYQPLGSVDDTGAYYAQTAFFGWPVLAQIGDTGQLGTVTIYSDISMTTVTGTQTLSYAMETDPGGDGSTAIFDMITYEADTNGFVSTLYDRYRVSKSGAASYVSSDLTVPGSGELDVTYTSFVPLVTPPGSNFAAAMLHGGTTLRVSPAAFAMRMPYMKGMMRAQQTRLKAKN
jgi:hypothetical protein